MEKTLSKHGKYWIITGTPEELYDNMHPGDIVKNFNGEWFELLHVADFSELSRELQAATWFFHPDSVWRAKDMQDGEEKYIQFHGYCPRKIKRPVEHEEPADQEHDDIKPYEFLFTFIRRPVKDKLPDHAGLWRDKDGDVWCVNNNLNAICVKSDDFWDFRGHINTRCEYKKYAPFTELTITEKEHTNEQE